MAESVIKQNKSNPSILKVGDFLSETQYYKVVNFNVDSSVKVENERGFTLNIGKDIIREGIYTANQYEEEVSVTRTELIEIFENTGDAVFTVCFMKKPKEKDIKDALGSINKGKIIPNKDIQKIVKNVYKGTERILVGYMVKTETGFGRSIVIDLELDKGDKPEWDARRRQVDHRSMKWLIYKNVKYVSRSK